MTECAHPECQRKAVSKGCCDKHYRRMLKRGSMFDHGSRKVDEGNAIERFHKKYVVNENECWIWSAGTRANAKGVLYPRHWDDNNKSIGAHRFSYLTYKGNINGKFVCHKCDTPLCVNPDHLFVGTHGDNMKDMTNKGRQCRWRGEEKYWRCKLTNKEAEKIRVEYKNGCISQHRLGEKYGVSQPTVGRIVRGESY